MFDPWVRKISWRRKWQPTPVFLSGKSRGWRSLAGYSPWGRKESDTVEHAHNSALLHTPPPPTIFSTKGIYGQQGLCQQPAGL